MQIEKAYLFGRQISAGSSPTPVLDQNVIFDSGVFNMNRMQTGFSLNDVVSLQEVYRNPPYSRELAYTTGENVFTSNIKILVDYGGATDGSVLVNHGTDEPVLVVENNRLKHVGRSNANANVDGGDYLLPVNFGTMVEEGYSRLYVTLEYSTQGIENPTSGTREIKICPRYKKETPSQIGAVSMLDISNPSFQLNDDATLTEHTFYVTIGSTKLSYAPFWIQLIMTHGTYLIKKIWFE